MSLDKVDEIEDDDSISEESIRHDELMDIMEKIVKAVVSDKNSDTKIAASVESYSREISAVIKELKTLAKKELPEVKVDFNNDEMAKKIEESNTLTKTLIQRIEKLTEIYSTKATKLNVVRGKYAGAGIDHVNIEYGKINGK